MPQDNHLNLELPSRTSVDDPGAHELASSESSDDHFSDAHSGLEQSSLNSPIDIPVTRVEKVDNEPSYETKDLGLDSTTRSRSASTPGDRPIPITVVEKVDMETASYGEVPGTAAHSMRSADAVPDMVVRASAASSRSSSISRARAGSTPGDLPIPITRVEKIDDKLGFGEVPGTEAYEKRKEDAEPDVVERVVDLPSPRS